MYNEATKTNNTYKQLLFQAYNDIVQKVSEDEATNYDELAIYLKGNAIPYRLNCEDLETLTELPLESGTKTGKPFKIKDANTNTNKAASKVSVIKSQLLMFANLGTQGF